MKCIAFVILLAACGGSPPAPSAPVTAEQAKPPPRVVLDSRTAKGDGDAWVIGYAAAGALITAKDLTVRSLGPAWTAAQLGRPVLAAGTLTLQPGASGDEWVLASGTLPPVASDDSGLAAAQLAVFAAINAHDDAKLETLLAERFALRVIEGFELDRARFIRTMHAAPIEKVVVRGEELLAYRAGDVGVVTGVQQVEATIAGAPNNGASRFVSVFEHRGGRWLQVVSLVAQR